MWKHQTSQIILITFISSFSMQVLQIYLCHMIKSLLGNIHWLWLSWGHQGSRAWWRPLRFSALTCCWSRIRSGSVCADLARKQNKNIFPNSLHLPRVCFWTVSILPCQARTLWIPLELCTTTFLLQSLALSFWGLSVARTEARKFMYLEKVDNYFPIFMKLLFSPYPMVSLRVSTLLSRFS